MKQLFDITKLPPAESIQGYYDPGIVLGCLCVMFRVGEEAEHEGVLKRVGRHWRAWVRELGIIDTYNRNLQIITHVLGCAAGKAWARKTIGMSRLKHWLFRYHNPDMVVSKSAPKPASAAPKARKQIKWKLIGLTPVSVFIGTKASAPAKQTAPRGPRKLAQKRPFTPARFVPWELGVIDDVPATQKEHEVRTDIYHRHIKYSMPNPLGIHYEGDPRHPDTPKDYNPP